jgi:hypothetical protein
MLIDALEEFTILRFVTGFPLPQKLDLEANQSRTPFLSLARFPLQPLLWTR